MNLITRAAVLLGLVATVGFAATWTERVDGPQMLRRHGGQYWRRPYYVDRTTSKGRFSTGCLNSRGRSKRQTLAIRFVSTQGVTVLPNVYQKGYLGLIYDAAHHPDLQLMAQGTT